MLQFDWKTFIGFILNFAIVYFLFKKFFYKSFKNVVDEREKSIQTAYEKNKTLTREAEQKIETASKQIKLAESQAKKIISDTNELAEEMVNQAKQESKKQVRDMIQTAEEEIRISMERSNQFLKLRALSMAQTLSQGMICSIMTYSMDCEFIKHLLLELTRAEIKDTTGKIISFQTALKNAIEQKHEISIMTAIEMPWEIKEEFRKIIYNLAEEPVELHFTKTNTISGGFKLNFGFTDLDFSIEGQVGSIVKQLSA